MSHLDRSALLSLLREEAPLSASDPAKRLKFSSSKLPEFDSEASAVIGVDIGGSKVVGVVTNLQGDILFRLDMSIKAGDRALDHLEHILALIQELRTAQDVAHREIKAIGVGAPSIVSNPEGVIVWSPALNWRNLPLKSLFEEQFGLPTVVENDVNLAALGESWFGCARGVSDLVAIFIGTGIGGGLILNGEIYRGTDGAASEIGYLLPTPADLGRAYEGFGRLESLVSGPGIVQRARERIMAGKTSVLSQADLNTKDVFDAARDGDPLAIQIVEETVQYLAQAITNITIILNPEMVVLGGGVTRSHDLLLEPIKNHLRGTIPVMPEIVLGELGDESVVKGAVAFALTTIQKDLFAQDTGVSGIVT